MTSQSKLPLSYFHVMTIIIILLFLVPSCVSLSLSVVLLLCSGYSVATTANVIGSPISVASAATNHAQLLLSHRMALTGYLSLAKEIQQRVKADEDIAFGDDIQNAFRVVEEGSKEFVSEIEELMRDQGMEYSGEVINTNGVDGFTVDMVKKESPDTLPRLAKLIFDSHRNAIDNLKVYLQESLV